MAPGCTATIWRSKRSSGPASPGGAGQPPLRRKAGRPILRAMQKKSPASLSAQEIERYKRHLVLKEIGGQGQQKLKAARVLVVGAGWPRLAAARLSRRGRRRHHRHRRRRPRQPRQPAAPDRARHGVRRHRQGRERRGHVEAAQPACHGRGHRGAARCRQCARAYRPLRHRRGRVRQCRDPLPRLRRLLSRKAHARVRGGGPVRRLRLDLQAAPARTATASPTRPTAASFPRRPRPAPFPIAPRPASSARWPVSLARCRRPRW